MKTSPYVTVGASPVRRPGGPVRVPVFRADGPTVVLLPPHLAAALTDHDVSGLDSAEVAQLVRAGLVSETHSARAAWYSRMGERADGSHREYVLLPTSYCNMGCEYCGQEHVKQSLTSRHRDRVSERVLKGIRAQDTRSCHVAWFGGEPLMAFATVKSMSARFVAAAADHGVSYTSKMTTNGALLDERKLPVLVGQCGIGRFDITIDGPADVHDVHRPMKNGRATWERLVGFLADQVSRPEYAHVSFVLRTNVDRNNASRIPEYLWTMAERGFAGVPNVVFQVAPIHSWGNDISSLELSREEAVRLDVEWLQLMHELDLHTNLVPEAVTVTCTATDLDHEVIDARGTVYSCNEHPLVPGYQEEEVIGTVESLASSARRPTGRFDGWYGEVADGKWPCSRCPMLPVCGGACPKLWHEGAPPCPTFKENLPERLTLHAMQHGMVPVQESVEEVRA